MRSRTVWLVVGSLMLASQPAWAARTPVHEAAESPEYGRKFGGMIGRGLLNGLTCFVDVLVFYFVNWIGWRHAVPPAL